MTTKTKQKETKPETLWVEHTEKAYREFLENNGDFSEKDIDNLILATRLHSAAHDDKLRAAQPKPIINVIDDAKLGRCPSCGKEYDSCKATEKGCAWWCYDCQEKDKAKIRAEGMAQGTLKTLDELAVFAPDLEAADNVYDAHNSIDNWILNKRAEAQKQTEGMK